MTRPFLRSTRANTPNWKEALHATRTALRQVDPKARRERARLEGRLGGLLTVDPRRLEEARSLVETSLRRARSLTFRRLVAADLMRLATIHQYSGRHRQAIRCFDRALAFIDAHRIRRYKDFALQHKGKCLAELEEYEAARECFRGAMRMRRRRGDTALIRSTEEAIAELQRRETKATAGHSPRHSPTAGTPT